MSQVKHSVHIDFKTDIKTLKQAEKELDKLSRALALIEGDSENLMGNSPEAVAELRKQLEKLQKAYDKAEKEGKHVFDDFNKDTLTTITNLTKLQLKHKSEIDMLEKQQRAADKANKSLEQNGGLLERVKKGMSGALIEGTIFTAFFALTSQISAAVQEAIQFDKTMTRIGIVTGRSVESMKSFAEYSFIASSRLGTTAQKFSEASLTFAQQGGLAQGYSTQLAEASIMLANITGTSAEDSSEAITAIANSFKMLESDGSKAGMKIADMLAALDASSGSSANEIADAFRRSASSFQAAGFSAEEASAMIATVSETTRQSAEMVGTGFKTMIGNLADLKVGSAETEAYVSKVSKLGEQLGIDLSIMNEAGTDIKSVPEILKMVATAYNEAGTLAQKQAIVEAVAGKEQRDRFIALIENQERYNELLGIAGNSAGAAQSANERYLDSIEAKLNKLKNEWNFFMSNLLNAEWFKAVIDKLTIVLMEINNASDNLPVQLAKIGQLITPWLMIAWTAFRYTAIDAISEGFERGTDNLKDELDSSSKKIDKAGSEMIRAANMMQNAANRMALANGGTAVGGDIIDGDGRNKNDNDIDGKNNAGGKKSGFLGKMGNVIKGGIGKVSGFFGGLLKVLGPIGWIVSGIMGIVSSLDVWANDSLSIWKKIGHTLYNIADSLLLGIPSLIGLDSWKDDGLSKERVELDRKIKEDDATAKESIRTSGKEVQDLIDVVKKSAIGSEEYTTAANRLGELFPGLVAGVDDLGNSILVSNGVMEDYIKTKQDELRIEQQNERESRVKEAAKEAKATTEKGQAQKDIELDINKQKEKIFDYIEESQFSLEEREIDYSAIKTPEDALKAMTELRDSFEKERVSMVSSGANDVELGLKQDAIDTLNKKLGEMSGYAKNISDSEAKIAAIKNSDKKEAQKAIETGIINQAGVKYSSDNLAAAKAGTMLSGENTEKLINSGLLGDKVDEFKKALENAYATVDAEGKALSTKQIQKNIEGFVETYGDVAIKAADEIESANKAITDKLGSKDFDITKVGFTDFLKQMAEANKMSVDELMKNTNVMSLYADAVVADFESSKDKVGQLDSITNQIVGNINGFTGSTAQAAFKNAKQTVLNAKNQAAAYAVYVASMMEYSQLVGAFDKANVDGITFEESSTLSLMASKMKYVKLKYTVDTTAMKLGMSSTPSTIVSGVYVDEGLLNQGLSQSQSTNNNNNSNNNNGTKKSNQEKIDAALLKDERKIESLRSQLDAKNKSIEGLDPVNDKTGVVNSKWNKGRADGLKLEKQIAKELDDQLKAFNKLPKSLRESYEGKKKLAEINANIAEQAKKIKEYEAETTRIISEDRIKGFTRYMNLYKAQAKLEEDGSQAEQNKNLESLKYEKKILDEKKARYVYLNSKAGKTAAEVQELKDLQIEIATLTESYNNSTEAAYLNAMNLARYGSSSLEVINKNKEALNQFYELDQNAHEQLIDTMQLQLEITEEIKKATDERYKSTLRAIQAQVKQGNLSGAELKYLNKKLKFLKDINSINKEESMRLVRTSSGQFRYVGSKNKEEEKAQKLAKAEEYSKGLREDALAAGKKEFDFQQSINQAEAKKAALKKKITDEKLTGAAKTDVEDEIKGIDKTIGILKGSLTRVGEDKERAQQEYSKSVLYEELIAAGKNTLADQVMKSQGAVSEELMAQIPEDIKTRVAETVQEVAIQTDYHVDAIDNNTNALGVLTKVIEGNVEAIDTLNGSLSGGSSAENPTSNNETDDTNQTAIDSVNSAINQNPPSTGNSNNGGSKPDVVQKVPGVVGKLDEKSEKITLQRRLNKLGESLDVDGIVGPKTTAAVKRFQKKNKLEVDGIVGPKTLAALKIAGNLIDKSLLKFDTGGYTGNSEGIAMLHEKELVLNKMDTENILKAVMALREMPRLLSPALPAIARVAPDLNQSVVINASFPAASSSDEIKKAFEALSTKALQYAYKKKSF